MPKQPQDHAPKKGAPFKFTGADGKQYALPLVSKGAQALSGGDLMDAALGGDPAQLVYLIKLLKAAGPSASAEAALRAMPQGDMMDVLTAWGDYGDGDGASLGE